MQTEIKRIELTEVVVPAKQGAINHPSLDKPLHKLPVAGQPGWSVQFDQVPKLILEMELENGVVGHGEFYRGHDWATVESVSEFLLGKDIESFTLQDLPIGWCREHDGFECAVWDCWAKAHDLRLADLLGGPVREEIKVGAWTGHRLPEEIGDIARRFAGRGYDCIKFKCDLEDDVVRWCENIAEAAPHMNVILDPNERWHYSHEARSRIAALEAIGNVLCLEDPIPRWKTEDYAELKKSSAIPLVLHVSLPYVQHGQRISDAVTAIRHRTVDGFNFNGGLADFQRLDHLAAAAGLPSWHGSEVDLGILEAMYLHSCAAAESCTWPSDIFGRLVRRHDLLKEPLQIQPPIAWLPEGPGLGVELDRDAVKNFQTQTKQYAI